MLEDARLHDAAMAAMAGCKLYRRQALIQIKVSDARLQIDARPSYKSK